MSVREAAIRVRGRFDGAYAERKHSMGNDINTLADAYLAEHLADDDEAVAVNWISSIGTGGKLAFYRDSKTWFVCFAGSDTMLRTVQTRGEVRQLCRALGIEWEESQ